MIHHELNSYEWDNILTLVKQVPQNQLEIPRQAIHKYRNKTGDLDSCVNDIRTLISIAYKDRDKDKLDHILSFNPNKQH